MDSLNTFSDIRNCFPYIQNNYFQYLENPIKANSACHGYEALLKAAGAELLR